MNDTHAALFDRLEHAGRFSLFDREFADLMLRMCGGRDDGVRLAAALTSAASRSGHICLDLRQDNLAVEGEDGPAELPLPSVDEWKSSLASADVVGGPGEYKPLILDGHRLYLQRYWECENRFCRAILERARRRNSRFDLSAFNKTAPRYFSDSGGEIDRQMVAAWTAAAKPLCIITGGPGTGKTTTVARLLAVCAELAGSGGVKIALAAPTGKAAARMEEALSTTLESIDMPPRLRAMLPTRSSTIHRLIGMTPRSSRPAYHRENPLPADLLVIDEASMVDLPLMTNVIDAVPQTCTLVIVGDRHQLSSVEPGAFLGDICDRAAIDAWSEDHRTLFEQTTGKRLPGDDAGPTHPLSDCIVELKKVYRYNSELAGLASAVNSGDAVEALGRLDSAGGLKRRDVPAPRRLIEALGPVILDRYRDFFAAAEPRQLFEAFRRFRILCARRTGPYGAESVNAAIEHLLARRGVVDTSAAWYERRPILVTQNDYGLKLFNGDIGITTRSSDTGELRVKFIGADNTLRSFHPAALPAHETAFAMTIHKSQGSEFDRVLLLMPNDDSPLLTRELLYTGITRAKSGVEVWCNGEIFRMAAERRTVRTSGLRERLLTAGKEQRLHED